MKILLESGCYDHVNQGDLAMLKVAAERLTGYCHNAEVYVVSNAPQLLTESCPNVKSVHPALRDDWFKVGKYLSRFYSIPAHTPTKFLTRIEKKIYCQCPPVVKQAIKIRSAKRRVNYSVNEVYSFGKLFYSTDLVVASGGGYIADAFKWQIKGLLDVLELAIIFGIPTALFGQGIGPVHDPGLSNRLKRILPNVTYIALREDQLSKFYVDKFAVNPERYCVTGDDAIELAYNTHPEKIGNGIGVNLRIAKYAETDNEIIDLLRSVIVKVSEQLHAPVLPVPITFDNAESDVQSLQNLLEGIGEDGDYGQNLNNPDKIIRQVGQCRIVISGSYHSAVFALSQGIPVIVLAQSEYYKNKFQGLAKQFGVGCDIILLDDHQLHSRLFDSIIKAWETADYIRPKLIEAAKRQIDLSRGAYKKVLELVNTGA